jgi:hypothetical protein
MLKSKIETLYLDSVIYRESYCFNDDGKAIKILSDITNTEARGIILDNLRSVTCVSKNLEGVVSFFVLNEDLTETTGYKIIDEVCLVKNYSNTPPEGFTFSNLTKNEVSMYGISEVDGEVELDVYFNDLKLVPGILADNFKRIPQIEGYSTFYGCKMRRDGSTYRYKTFSMSLDIDTIQEDYLEGLNIEEAVKQLRAIYEG